MDHEHLSTGKIIFLFVCALPRKLCRPSLFDLLEALWSEGTSHHWKIPTVGELEDVQEELILDIATSPLALRNKSTFFVWALDERLHMFVAYSPFTRKVKSGELPERIGASMLKGQAPDSRGSCYAYAARVIVKDASHPPFFLI